MPSLFKVTKSNKSVYIKDEKSLDDYILKASGKIEKKMKNRIPLKRMGEHIELADLATFLISDQASYINGEVVTIDGGEWLKGAGQFNELERVPQTAWKLLNMRRKKKK